MTDWKYYPVETCEQIAARIKSVTAPILLDPFDCAVCEIEAAQKEIERLQSELKAANDDADRLANELEETYAQNDICWEEPGESSPALIAHKSRVRTLK